MKPDAVPHALVPSKDVWNHTSSVCSATGNRYVGTRITTNSKVIYDWN